MKLLNKILDRLDDRPFIAMLTGIGIFLTLLPWYVLYAAWVVYEIV